MTIKKAAAGTLAGLLVVAALTSCSNENSDTPSTKTDQPVTLKFQSLSDQPAAIAAVEGIVAQWNNDNPMIQVKIIPAGWDGVYDKLITQFNGDVAPDIIHYEAGSIVSFAADGYLADLTNLMSAGHKADIPAGVLESVSVDGKIIAYPTELQSYMVFANAKMLADAGVSVPTGDTMTWEEFRAIAKATTKGDTYGVAWGLKSPTATVMSISLGFDGTFFSGSGDNVTFDAADKELAAIKQIHDMAYIDKSILPVTLTQSGGQAIAAFYAGQTALTVQASYQVANMANDAPEGLEWIVLPPLEGTVSAAQAANPQTLSVSADSPYIEQAVQFLEFFTNAQNLAAICTADALIPATTSAADTMATQLAGQAGWDTILASGKIMEAAPFMVVNRYQAWKDTVATPAFQKYLAAEIDEAGLKAELTNGWESVNS
jgi:ABC-type glycerol-3-phosphate transport system substrate-binding protein